MTPIRSIAFMTLMLAVACGPSVVPDEQPDTSASTEATTTSSETATSSGDSTAGSTGPTADESTDASTGSDAEPVLSPSLSADLTCQETGAELFVDALLANGGLEGPLTPACSAPSDLDQPGIGIWIHDWDGAAGSYTVGEDGVSVVVTPIGEDSTGTLEVEVDAAWSPTTLRLDLQHEGEPIVGVIELGTCLVVPEPLPCR